MSISALRQAVTTAGGTPTQYGHVPLLRQLITAWGGSPSYFDITNLLRQAITVAGGTPTQFQHTALLRQLVTTLGGTPATYNADKLYAQLSPIAVIGSVLRPLSLSAFNLTENAAAGTVIGAVQNQTATSTLGFAPSGDAGGRVAWSGSNLVAGATNTNFETDGASLSITVRETLAGYTNSPRDTVLTINVVNVNDTTPSAFTFTDLTNVSLGTTQTSNTITISGLGASDSATATLTGDASSRMQKNGGSFVTGPLTVVNGDTITVQHTSSGANSTAVNTILTIGTTTDTFTSTTVAAASLAAPVLTRTSAAGTNPPTWDSVMADLQDGDTIELYFTTNGVNPVTGTPQDTHIADAREETVVWTSWPATFASGVTVKWAQRYGRNPGSGMVWSPLSNILSDVMPSGGTSTATLVAASGNANHKSNIPALSSPFLTMTGPGGGFNGAPCSVRATAATTGQRQFEATIGNAATSAMTVGIDDGSTNLNSGFPRPGISLRILPNGGGWSIVVGGTQTQSGATSYALGDTTSAVVDTGAATCKFFLTHSGTTTQIGTTVTSIGLTNFYAFGSLEGSETLTFNFGASAFVRALDPGFTYYG